MRGRIFTYTEYIGRNNRRLVQDPSYALITVIHELYHVRHTAHSREFWQLYEDVGISEGILLERVPEENKSLNELKTEDIPIDGNRKSITLQVKCRLR